MSDLPTSPSTDEEGVGQPLVGGDGSGEGHLMEKQPGFKL
jgi:hypothetical protein